MFRIPIAIVASVLAVAGIGSAVDEYIVRQPNSYLLIAAESREMRDQLDGKWEVVELIRGDSASKVLPEEDMHGTVEFEGNTFRFVITSLGQEMDRWEATMSVDYARSPGTIDLTFVVGPDSGRTAAGIFELNGDELRICLPIRHPFDDRPTELNAPQGSNRALFTLHRAKK
jgi:uncharacterized protein (TIGR03067 family)